MTWAVLETPIGPVSVGVRQEAVRAVRLPSPDRTAPGPGAAGPAEREPDADPPRAGTDPLLADTVAQLRAYFAGERTSFTVPLSIPEDRGTAFERAVWRELCRIPYGETRTYGEVAAAVRDAGDARAVGTACHRNPLPLLVPCHRVVGAGGKLVGFGGGLDAKRWLLEHEARISMQLAWGGQPL